MNAHETPILRTFKLHITTLLEYCDCYDLKPPDHRRDKI